MHRIIYFLIYVNQPVWDLNINFSKVQLEYFVNIYFILVLFIKIQMHHNMIYLLIYYFFYALLWTNLNIFHL